MIGEAELRRRAARWGVDPMVVDLDHALGWFIAALAQTKDRELQWCFKGGPCLRKCYFSGYRFSEDLDFTAVTALASEQVLGWVGQASRWAERAGSPSYRASEPRLEVVKDEYGDETYQIRVYYRGALAWGGPPRAIPVDITRDERIVQPCTGREVIHPYSDA